MNSLVISDWDIKVYIEKKLLIINPLFPDTIRENSVDRGFGHQFCRFKKQENTIVDTKTMELENILEYIEVSEETGFTIYPGEHVLSATLEYVELPFDLIGFVNLRSTFARYGLYIPPTIINAGFKGELTIEIVGSNIPIEIYPNQRFLHVIFARTSSPVYKPYTGKYQGQKGVTPPKPDNKEL